METTKKLLRDTSHSIIGGVCSGLAAYFGLQKSRVRIVTILLFIFGGIGLLMYIALWIIIPKASTKEELEFMNQYNG